MLDLGGADAHATLWGSVTAVTEVTAATPAAPELGAGPFDTIFSVFALAATPDLDPLLSRIGDALAPDGRLLFLEPSRGVGATSRLLRVAAPSVRWSTGFHVDRDLPAELRRCGLSVTDVERHTSRTTQWWLRHLVEGVAHRSLLTR